MSSMQDVIGAILAAATLKDRGAPSRKLLPDYTYTTEAANAYDQVMTGLADLLGGLPIAENKASGFLADLTDAYEHQGFINGFRYALQFSKELTHFQMEGGERDDGV